MTKPIHMAAKMSELGVSALCSLMPRPINLRRASWTNRSEAVTCTRCLAALRSHDPASTRGESDG